MRCIVARMTLEPFDIRDPALLVTQVAEQVAFVEDTAYVVLVRDPSTDQEIVEVRSLDLPALLDDDDDISNELRKLARSFVLPDVGPPRHALVTILVRPGRCVFGPNEGVWLRGWRYSNHCAPVYSSELILVTEHGWAHIWSDFAGHEPRMALTG